MNREPLGTVLQRLAAGSRRHAARSPGQRAAIAAATATSVAGSTEAWAGISAAIEEGAGEAPILAEEIATGPLATLRLLRLTAQSLDEIDRFGSPLLSPRLAAGRPDRIDVGVLPTRGLCDGVIFSGHSVTVRCGNPGGVEAFERLRAEEAAARPGSVGVAVVLGAGNVTALAPADAICQIFEHGRSALLKLHPIQQPLEQVFRAALAPLVSHDLLDLTVGGAEVADEALASPLVTHVHLTGGRRSFDAIAARCAKPITCELGNVTPWIVVPGDYTPAELFFQADAVAASILNNASFNCIATKLVVTAKEWRQREAFLDRIRLRLAATPPRRAWYPGSATAWETLAESPAPADGTLPWLFRCGIDPGRDRHWFDREWFIPACAEVAIEGVDTERFCVGAAAVASSLPGSLAASVTVPSRGDSRDRHRAEMLVEHLGFGVVGVNCWSALAYMLGNVPWGGLPGATLADPKSGIGFVHDPLLLPLVHHSIIRGPLVSRLVPPWAPWHPRAAALARGMVRLHAGGGTAALLRMLPNLRFQV